jgi:hypothetical protein
MYNYYSSPSLTQCSFSVNSASSSGYGGGIYNRGGTLTLYNSIISNNLATAGMLSLGGGIYNQGGTLTLYSSTISDNSINSYYGAGAGIYNEAGLVTLNNSTLSNNLIPFGRGAFGGGIYSKGGRLTLNNSTLADNSVLAMTGSRGGGIYNEGGTLTITNSTLSGNSSRGIRDFGGGGIYNQRGVVFLNNSTLSGNSSLYAGGGIYNEAGLLTITNSTLSGNSALYDGSVGGGVYNGSRTQASTLIIRNSLIASNNATTGREVANQGTAISEGYNLFGYNRSSGVDGMTLNATDVVPNVSFDRILAPLANNGGSTQTHALVPGSPAINTGDPNLITPDQRGFPRFGRADIGAFEFQSFNLLPEPPEGNLPEITLPVFSLADISEITAALYGQETRLPILTLQPQPNKPILCVIRRQAGNGQQRDEYGGLPDCP